MKALVAGCGYLGHEVAVRLVAVGWDVVGLTHSEHSAQDLRARVNFPVETCDLSEAASVDRLRAHNPDAVVHCASSGRGGVERYEQVYLKGCLHLNRTFPRARLLFTSSTSVYPQVEGEAIDETSPAEPARETGKVLRKAEDAVLKADGIVVRLSGIYGPGRSVILQRFLDGSGIIESGVSRYLNQIHRDDAASAIVTLLNRGDEAAGQVYNVTDGSPTTQRETYEGLASHFGRPAPPEGPRDLNRKRGWTHKRIQNDKLCALGWRPLYPSFLDAVRDDPELLPSIEKLVT